MAAYKKKPKQEYDQKTADLTYEERQERAENLEARAHWHDSAVKTLCSAICLGTIKDYRRHLRQLRLDEYRMRYDRLMTRKDKEKLEKQIETVRENIKDCEDFFESDMFVICTGVESKEEAIRKILAIPDGYDHLLEGGLIG